MMRMLKERNYQGKVMRVGDTFEPTNPMHRRQFLAIKHAEDVGDDESRSKGKERGKSKDKKPKRKDADAPASPVTEDASVIEENPVTEETPEVEAPESEESQDG